MIGIKVQDLTKRFGTTRALDRLRTEFEPERLHGLIGPEGAGKTTLLRALAGLLRPSDGTIRYYSTSHTLSFGEIREKVAYMPQQQSLYPDLSIAEHLDFFRDLYGIPRDAYRERRKRLLDITRLGKFADRRAGQLSGGMYKKLGLMCALLRSPQVLLLDEPTNGVDPISRRELWELLYAMMDQRILILISTAYMDEAERCGKVHLMQAGRLLLSGDPGHILEQAGVQRFDDLFLKFEGATP